MSDILKQEVILRKSKRTLIIGALFTGLIAIGCFTMLLNTGENNIGKWGIIVFGLFLFARCIYYLNELRSRKIEIIISTEGISLRGYFFYTWPSIESFSTDKDDGDVALILKIKNQDSVHFDVTCLELKEEELIEVLLSYGQPSGLTYSTH